MKKTDDDRKHSIELGLRLKEVRKSKSLTQKAFADIGKVSVQSQKLYEAGTRSPNSEYLNNLVIFGIDACYIFSGIQHGANNFNESLNREVLVEVLEIIESFSLERETPLKARVKVDLASLFYVPFSTLGKVDRDVIFGYLKHIG